MSEELKPCPFCGFADISEEFSLNRRQCGVGLFWEVFCRACDSAGRACATKDEAISAWNRRTPSPSSATGKEEVAAHNNKGEDARSWAIHPDYNPTSPSNPPSVEAEPTLDLAAYDAGLLSDYGGGNVEWWQDYLRSELATAHEFYQLQVIANWPLTHPQRAGEISEEPSKDLRRIFRSVYRLFEHYDAEIDILAAIGSWGDTLDDCEIADLLEAYIQDGKLLHGRQ